MANSSINFTGNPFGENDVDDDAFLNHPRHGTTGYILGNDSQNRDVELRRQQILEERRRLENSILQSSNNAVSTLYETEQVGIATAEELVNQGEKLRKTERNLDEINQTMKQTQSNINAMKSIFGSIKQYFSSRPADTSRNAPESEPPSEPETVLKKTLTQVRDKSENARTANHPALKNHGADYSGFGAASPDQDGAYNPWGGAPQQGGASQQGATSGYKSRSHEVDERFNANLSQMSEGLDRLKTLAHGLGDELNDHLDVIDRIGDKVDRADASIRHQDSQMRRILKR